ncbi:MAG: class I SAM-dependent methyltransferase [Armatimonadota bacterium]
MPVVERREGLAKLVARHSVTGVLVVSPEKTAYHEPASGLKYFFHPSMAKVRLHNCVSGEEDPMLRAMELQEGDSVLDCTLGRATDATICAWKVGPTGRVLGLEKSRILAELTIDGLAHYEDSSRKLTELLRRVEAICADYNEYLPTCAIDSFDVVYFDPIFHAPLEKSQAMAPLRALADGSPLSPAAVQEGRRVARRFVVIKQRKKTPLWEELRVTRTVSSPGGTVEYGVIEACHPDA